MADFLYVLRCFICGFAMCFPGLSGAGTASVLGIYGDMLNIFKNIPKNRKKGIAKLLATLFAVLSGAVVFYIVFADPVKRHPQAFLYAGSAVMTAGLFFFVKNSDLRKSAFSFAPLLYFAFGAAIPFSEKFIESSGSLTFTANPFALFVCGIFLSAAIILPGISFSYMLSFLGLYDKLINDLNEGFYLDIFVLVTGIFLGIVILTSLLSRFMENYKSESDCFIIGFIVSAIINSFIPH